MLAGIKEILIISTPKDISSYKALLGDGNKLGVKFSYKVQPSPNGLAEAFILGEKFIGSDNICLILGDNIFYGPQIRLRLKESIRIVKNSDNAVIYGYYVNDPERYGVVDFDSSGNVLSIEEKPANPKSNYAVAGLYFYPNNVIDVAKEQIPSNRNELEITDTNKYYLKQKKLKVEKIDDSFTWLDTGTHDSLLEASQFVQTLEKRQGVKISCIEEIAYKMKYINKEQLLNLGEEMSNNSYGQYLIKIANST